MSRADHPADHPADHAADLPDADGAGHPAVDAAVARLTELEGAPTDRHPEVYDDVHRRLRDALSDLDGS